MKKRAVQYWDDMAATSDAYPRDAILCGFRSERSFDKAGYIDARHLLAPFVRKKDTVLDIGCGIGRLTKWIAPLCDHAIGLDVSQEMLKIARARLAAIPNVRFKRLPISLRFPVRPRSIDFAYLYHVSEHLDREDTFVILQQIRQALQKGGRALIQFSLISHPDNQREFRKWVDGGDDEGVRSRFYTEEEASTLLRLSKLYPQIRIYIPGEFVVVVACKEASTLGAMPVFSLLSANGECG